MEKFTDLLTKIEGMTVAELNEFVRALEEKFGVSAAAMVAAAPGAGGAAAEEKSTFDVVLANAGAQKIQVIKVVKDVLGIGLVEAKALVEGAPKTVKAGVAKPEAEELKKKLEEAGAAVELK